MNLFDLHSQSQKPIDGQAKSEHALRGQPYSQMQIFFLLRLMHLLDTRRHQVEATDNWQLKLLDNAIYSTYLDCLEQGVGDDARSLLHQREAAKQS